MAWHPQEPFRARLNTPYIRALQINRINLGYAGSIQSLKERGPKMQRSLPVR